MACLPTDRNCVMSAQEAPIILGRVCRLWRTASLASPRLWSKLHIVEPTRPYNSPPGVFEAKVAQRLEITKTWLGRSGQCALSISLESNLDHHMTPPLTPSPGIPNTNLFLHAIVPFASRWQNIRLVIPPPAFEALSDLGENDVPLLKHLDIVQRPDHPHTDGDGHWKLSSILRGCNLSSFSISGGNMNPSDFPLRWSQLTNLSLAGHSAWGMGFSQTVDDVLRVLSRCPELRTCKLLIHSTPDGQSLDPFDRTTKCVFLHTVDLLCIGAPLHTSGYLLSHLSLPGLRHFKLRGHGAPDSSPESLIASLGASRLDSIDFDSDIFSQPSMVGLLRSLPPSIRRLQIADHRWQSTTEGALNDGVLETLNANMYCPALQDLIIADCRTLSDEALLRFIKFRMIDPSCTPLKRVEVYFSRERQMDILSSLEPFTEQGLRHCITHTAPALLHFSPWQGLDGAPLGTLPWTSPHMF
ncbi:hypothetical protein C8R43DRAFT_51110 [Mycena crocata]|nr:hypothetical protein C8R43DRAFT_51110 [Mycena crocata]